MGIVSGVDGSVNRLRALVPWPDLDNAPKTVRGGESDAVVIVAVESYRYVPPIPGAVSNALAWQTYFTVGLGVPTDRVRILTDYEATKEDIERALDRAAGQARARGRVWFVFIGHGAPSKDAKDGLLLGADVRQTANSLQDRSVRHSDVITRLEQGLAQPILVLDTCFSGRTGSGEPVGAAVVGLQPVQLATLKVPKRALVLVAAKNDQYAGPLPGRARPAFSYLVLGALRGWGDGDRSGEVTAAEVLAYTNRAMGTVIKGRDQTAELVGDGALVLALSGGEAEPDLASIQRALAQGAAIGFNTNGVVLTELPSLQLADLGRGELDLGRIDIAKEKAMEKQYLALEQAKLAIEAARASAKDDPTGTKQQQAWCELAELEGPNPYQGEARKACAQVRSYVEQRKRLVAAMQRDWEETVVPFMALEHRSVDEKKQVMQAFVGSYGVLPERVQVKAGARALAMLEGGRVPSFEAFGEMSVVRGMARDEDLAMVRIAGGRFDGRRVATFELDRTEVTVAAYRACVRAGTCKNPDRGRFSNYDEVGRGEHPVNEVSALDADAYCRWAGKRLPSEWEWEWAARGREEGRRYPWGDAEPSCSLAVMVEGGKGCGERRTWPVGSKPKGASRDGVLDLAGNVWEWTASTDGGKRVLRGGGGFRKNPAVLLVAYRDSLAPSFRSRGVGFRCAKGG